MRIFAALVGVAGAATLGGSCSTDLGDLPARCPDGECPEGYDCINAVCAKPGTAVPVTVARPGLLLGRDLRAIPQPASVLVVWQTYAYSSDGQSIVGVRVYPDGSVSDRIVLENTWRADAGLLEPFYEVFAISELELLVAMSSSPLGDDPRPRLGLFTAALPAEGLEAGGTERADVWGTEVLMPTIGYGAVSQPHLVRVADDRIDLGYFQTLSATTDGGGGGGGSQGGGGSGGGAAATIGQLAVFELDVTGAFASPLPTCDSDDYACCPAHQCVGARDGLPLAIGVIGAYAHAGGVTWILDDTRPTALTLGGPTPAELQLPLLAVPLAADENGVLLLEPSQRAGDQLPTDPVQGPASFGVFSASGANILSKLPGVRDTPRPAWARRQDRPAILVTPGTDMASPELLVYTVDEVTGDASEITRVKRFSSLPIGAVQAAVSAGKLFVVWMELANEEAVIRAAVLDEP